MTKHNSSQIKALKDAATKKREDTIIRVSAVLEEMKIHDIPITFQSVSKIANVSRDWLYKNDEICKVIRKSRPKNTAIKKAILRKQLLDRKNAQIDVLTKRLKTMQDEMDRLKLQIEVAYGEIYKEKC